MLMLDFGSSSQATFAERLGSRDNSLGFIRLCLAVLVIFAHAMPTLGIPGELEVGGLGLGGLAVGGFFAASGYLIADSRHRSRIGAFFLRRIARIYPAYWVSLTIIAMVIAPFADAVWGSGWSLSSAFGYVIQNASLIVMQGGIAGGPLNLPYPHVWNASIWTLAFEFAAYVLTAMIFSIPLCRKYPLAAAGCWFAFGIVAQYASARILPLMDAPPGMRFIVVNGAWLATFYAAGVLFWALRSMKVWDIRPLGIATLMLLIAVPMGEIRTIGALPLGYLVLWLGAVLPVRLGSRTDLSYGTYVYAFPVQQTIAVSGVADVIGAIGATLLAVGIVLPVAWGSWRLIERPGFNACRRLIAHHRWDEIAAHA